MVTLFIKQKLHDPLILEGYLCRWVEVRGRCKHTHTLTHTYTLTHTHTQSPGRRASQHNALDEEKEMGRRPVQELHLPGAPVRTAN